MAFFSTNVTIRSFNLFSCFLRVIMPSFTDLQFPQTSTNLNVNSFFDVLIHAASTGNRSYVRDILDNYPGLINRKDQYGRTALMYAAEIGCDLICSTLIYRRANVDIIARDKTAGYHHTPLSLAIQNNYLQIVKLLLSAKVSVHQILSDDSQMCAIHLAAECGNELIIRELVQYDMSLLNKKDAQGRTALLIATKCGHLDVVKYLVEQGADLECTENYASQNEYNFLTPLLLARALKFKYQDQKALYINYQLLEIVLIQNGAIDTISPQSILSLLDLLIDKIKERNEYHLICQDNSSKSERLNQIKNWLSQRICHKGLKSVTIQRIILSTIAKVCADSSLILWFTPESSKDFSSWVSWHFPDYRFDVARYASNQEFERDYSKMKSYISMPSLDKREWADFVKKGSTVTALINNNIFKSTRKSLSHNSFGQIDSVTGMRRLPM